MAGIASTRFFMVYTAFILFCYLQFHKFLLLFNIPERYFGAHSCVHQKNPPLCFQHQTRGNNILMAIFGNCVIVCRIILLISRNSTSRSALNNLKNGPKCLLKVSKCGIRAQDSDWFY